MKVIYILMIVVSVTDLLTLLIKEEKLIYKRTIERKY